MQSIHPVWFKAVRVVMATVSLTGFTRISHAMGVADSSSAGVRGSTVRRRTVPEIPLAWISHPKVTVVGRMVGARDSGKTKG